MWCEIRKLRNFKGYPNALIIINGNGEANAISLIIYLGHLAYISEAVVMPK